MLRRAVQPIVRRASHTLCISAYMSAREKYGDWSRNQLLRRIAQLEGRASSLGVDMPAPEQQPNDDAPQRSKKQPRPFDMMSQPCRKIALRFCYDGGSYSGLAAQMGQLTPLPTVEETIWEALCTARLVDATKSMDDADWSRCGRTDAGVSAAGQVVALWVRSRCVDERGLRYQTGEAVRVTSEDDNDELPYVATLNRLLPPTIRIQAWSPVRPTFSSRFDCVYRHYKYFFTLGAPSTLTWQPESASHYVGPLDVERMRDAAARLVGEHDFRNMCKVDASKQITNFRRRIDGATIDRVSHGWPDCDVSERIPSHTEEPMYVLNLRGSAFLYHQVRHIMAVLFMVGARLEEPSIVDELVNVHTGAAAADRIQVHEWIKSMDGVDSATPDKALVQTLDMPSDASVVETRPTYEMAADRPLMLWECGFRPEHVQWRATTYAGTIPTNAPMDYTPSVRSTSQLHALWTRDAIHTELMRHLVLSSATGLQTCLPSATTFADARVPLVPAPSDARLEHARAHLVPLGNGILRPTTQYKPLLMRPRDVSADVKNKKWREGKGKRRAERRQAETNVEDASI